MTFLLLSSQRNNTKRYEVEVGGRGRGTPVHTSELCIVSL